METMALAGAGKELSLLLAVTQQCSWHRVLEALRTTSQQHSALCAGQEECPQCLFLPLQEESVPRPPET